MLRVQRGMPSSRCVVSHGLLVSNSGFEWRFTRAKPICATVRFYSGPDLDRCARLVALAHGGQVILSHTSHELLDAQSLEGFSFRELGKYRLGDLRRAARIHQLCHGGLASSFPPLTRPVDSPSNLPVIASSFVGRAEELAEILELLSRVRLATLTGSGGCGKTRLALEAGRALLAGSPDGVWWVDLAPVADPSMVPMVALAALVAETGGGGIHSPRCPPSSLIVSW